MTHPNYHLAWRAAWVNLTELPGYWVHETGGKLQPAMCRYLNHAKLAPGDVEAIRAYFVQWIYAPCWMRYSEPGREPTARQHPHMGPIERAELAALRAEARLIASVADIDRWVARATDFGVDPL